MPRLHKVILKWVFGWLRLRRERREDTDVAVVSIYGADNRSILLDVRVPYRD
jgi:hypothetical protein